MKNEIEISVSPVCSKEGKNYAFVMFKEGEKSAEGKIPECMMIRNDGFDEAEVNQFIDYMRANLTSLKKMAASINPLSAFMKEI